ncbi:MAG TPA: acyl-ACP--UDP-N-acetylglucosamine O-acyltransferase [Halanaerobiales bacterium]|nr:acyl-ACP--UDP-N-acetylglucosamine O-acyltransferase [Halanaerobiales bacterium]
MRSGEQNNKVLNISDKYQRSYIHPNAKIGKNVEIGPFSTIGPYVEIGDNTKIGSHVVIKGETTIGLSNKIYHGASLGVAVEDNKNDKNLFIGDNNIIREFVKIESGSSRGNGETKIGNNNMIMSYCYISTNCNLSNHIIMTNASSLGEEVLIEDHAVIAGMTTIKDYIRIGRVAMVGGHSNVLKDVPPYVIVDGHPAHVSGINIIGLRRNKIKPSVRKEIKKAYKILYRSDYSIKDAINKMDNQLSEVQEIEHFLRFLRNVQRGICQ